MSKSVTSASGDTKAIAGTKDDGQWRRRGPGTRPWVQLSPPGPGSAGLRTAERGREEERESNDKGGSHCPAPAATPKLKRNKAPTRRPCQADQRRGRAAQGDPPGQGVPERRPRGPPPPPSAPGQGRRPHSPTGRPPRRPLPSCCSAAATARPRVSRGGAVSAGEVGQRARSALRLTPRAGHCSAAQGRARPRRRQVAGGRGLEAQGPGTSALVLLLLRVRSRGPFKPEGAGRKCVTRGPPRRPALPL